MAQSTQSRTLRLTSIQAMVVEVLKRGGWIESGNLVDPHIPEGHTGHKRTVQKYTFTSLQKLALLKQVGTRWMYAEPGELRAIFEKELADTKARLAGKGADDRLMYRSVHEGFRWRGTNEPVRKEVVNVLIKSRYAKWHNGEVIGTTPEFEMALEEQHAAKREYNKRTRLMVWAKRLNSSSDEEFMPTLENIIEEARGLTSLEDDL